jgi:hypothetical protein
MLYFEDLSVGMTQRLGKHGNSQAIKVLANQAKSEYASLSVSPSGVGETHGETG